MAPKVSIIVPVYNAQKVLEQCIESVLKQDFEDFELLLMDDGSTDGSGEICDKYAQMDARVHVVHKENTGVSDTRNKAIGMAAGTYLQFLDSDDWITKDATRLMVEMAEIHHCDMVICDFYRVVGERLSQKGAIAEDGIMSRKEFAENMLENPADFYYGVLWNKLYRRDIVKLHHLSMDAEISWCEDFMFNLEYIQHAEQVYVLKVPVYYYVKTKGSLVSQGSSITKTIKMKRMVFEYYKRFYKAVFDEEDYEKSRLMVYRFLIDAAGDGVVPPAILPGVMKLGDERTQISVPVAESCGIFAEAYRERKMLDRFMEAAALKNDISLDEAEVLFYLNQHKREITFKEVAEMIGISRWRLSAALQKLENHKLVKVHGKEGTKAKGRDIELLEDAFVVLEDLEHAKQRYETEKFAGFSEEELEIYMTLEDRIKENIQRVLK